VSPSPEPIEVRLDDGTVDRLAHRVAELLASERPAAPAEPAMPPGSGKQLSAAQVAEWWDIDRAWVYAHADELGVSRLGTGPRPRLRFDADTVRTRLAPPKVSGPQDHPDAIAADARRLHRTPDESSQLLGFRADPELSSNDPNESRSGANSAPPIGTRRTARSTR
jgi:hypothetical protein